MPSSISPKCCAKSSTMRHIGIELDWVVPHQANARILDATARKLGLPERKSS